MKDEFKIIKTHPKIAFLDDDKSSCEAMALSMSKLFPSEAFDSEIIALKTLKKENERLRKEDREIAKILSQESPARTLESAYNWLSSRVPLLEVCFCDYDLGYSTGITVLQEIKNSLIRRIIITGVATDEIAVAAFNDGYIDGFLKKNKPSLRDAIEETCRLGAKRTKVSQITSDDYDPLVFLQDSHAVKSLNSFIEKLKVRDYIVLAKPLGILVKLNNEDLKWIHLETESSLKDTIGFLKEDGVASTVLRQVAAGELGVCPDLFNAFPQAFAENPMAAMEEISEEPWLIAGVIDLPKTCTKGSEW